MENTEKADIAQQSINLQDIIQMDVSSDPVTLDQFKFIRHMNDQMPIGISISILISAFITWLVWPYVAQYILFPWLGFISVTCTIQYFFISEFSKSKTIVNTSNQWPLYNTFLSAVVAFSMGVGYLLFVPYLSIEFQLYLLCILTFFAITLIPVLSSITSSYIIFISALSIPVLISLIIQPVGTLFVCILTMVSLYGLLAVFSVTFNQTLMNSFNLANDITERIRLLKDTNEKIRIENNQLKKKASDALGLEEKLRQEYEKAEIILRSISDAIITVNIKGEIEYINPIAESLIGQDEKQAYGKNINEVFRLVNENSRESIENPALACMEQGVTISDEENYLLLRTDGYEFEIEFSAAPTRDNNHKISGAVFTIRDVTNKRIRAKNLTWQATHDSLTNLINRREFESRLNKLIELKDSSRQHAVCYIDLDNFKAVNDTGGHPAGDELLKKIAMRIKGKTRDSDTLARLGGDEFGLILYNCNLEKARILAEAILREINVIDFSWEQTTFDIGMSIGLVGIGADTKDTNEIIKRADNACYKAKEEGKNRVYVAR